MKLKVELQGDLRAILSEEIEDAKIAVSNGVWRTGESLKKAMRAQVAGAFGRRLGNAIKQEDYPDHPSLRAASFVFAKSAAKRNSRGADQIIDGFNKGSVITANGGKFLAIPLPSAGRGRRGRSNITPEQWEEKTGLRLRFVGRRGKSSLLVADDARISVGKNRGGQALRKGGKRRQDGMLVGAVTVPIFALVRVVKLPKRLDLEILMQQAQAQLAGNILAAWPRAK